MNLLDTLGKVLGSQTGGGAQTGGGMSPLMGISAKLLQMGEPHTLGQTTGAQNQMQGNPMQMMSLLSALLHSYHSGQQGPTTPPGSAQQKINF